LGVSGLTAVQDAGVARAAREALLWIALSAPLLALKRGRAAALLLLLAADLWRFGHDLQPLARDDFFRKPVALAGRLQGRGDRFCIDPWTVNENARPLDGATAEEGYQSLRQVLFLNAHAPFRIHQTWAYEVFPNSLFTELRHQVSLERPQGPLLDLLGARFVVTTRRWPPPAVYRGQRPNAILYENPRALPRVAWVPEARVIADKDERLKALAGAWDPRKEVILEEGGGASGAKPEALDWKDGPGWMSAGGRSDGGWLVYTQVAAPGWEAYLNGRRAPLLRADHALQAVALPAGGAAWDVIFRYRPRWLAWGLALTTLLAGGFLGAGFRKLLRPLP
jgi:hypothetical protein